MANHVFELKGDFIHLIALLKATGLAVTGGHAKMIVEDGEVSLNGEVETQKRKKIKKGDIVSIDGQTIEIQ